MRDGWRVCWRSLALVWMAPFLAGCGGSPPTPPPTPAVQNSNLAGNWLLAGGLPLFTFASGTGTHLTMTFSTDGAQVSGSGEYFVSCGDIGGGGSIDIQGTIKADGSFSAQTTTLPSGVGASLVVSGHVPAGVGVPWTGSYTIDTTNAGTCQVRSENAIAAQPIASFSGTYAGMGTYDTGTAQTPVSLKMTLQQGVDVQDAEGTVATATNLLSGTIAVTGVPCFSHGTLQVPSGVLALRSGIVWGDSVHPSFQMDDGSILRLGASIADVSDDSFTLRTAFISGGKCAAPISSFLSSSPGLRITSLTRVS